MAWMDVTLLSLLFSLGTLLAVQGFWYLSRRDAQEARRNCQDACHPHQWIRLEPYGLICRLCGKIPG